jgi:hypothetical protein
MKFGDNITGTFWLTNVAKTTAVKGAQILQSGGITTHILGKFEQA